VLPEVKMENPARKDRIVILFVLGSITLAAWAYLSHMAMDAGTHGMLHDAAIPCVMSWGAADLVFSFLMWSVMMVAMMIPSATPMFLAFAVINEGRNEAGYPLIATGSFVMGYLIIWLGFSAASALIQWGLHATALLSEAMVIAGPIFGGALLIAAGVFQWTPFRDACMVKCRSPMAFIITEWREGKGGALIMGLKHGVYCVGCCWLLMALSLVLGVMNLVWMAVLTVFMALEKGSVAGLWLSRAAGAILVMWGVALVLFKSAPG
jgi:predicted metal-binding membrane protein